MKSIIFKFIEVIVKISIILCFISSVFIFIITFGFFAVYDFDIDFTAKSICIEDYMRAWNYDEGICMWVNEEKQQ
jgi:hypothetical protein